VANTKSARELPKPDTYNIYDKGYKTGSQMSVFIGPIWLEEIVSLQLDTSSSDQEIWSYSNPYFDRLMIGRYRIRGSIGVTYTEPDYLLRVITEARDISIQDNELYDIINNRKNVFENTLKYRMITEKVLQGGYEESTDAAINRYVDRISREIELMSLSGERLNPKHFELTIITGNIYDDEQAIEIFEDAKIIGTGKISVVDDNAISEIYSFVAKRKPDRKKVTELPNKIGSLSKRNLITMAKEVTEQLADKLLSPPEMKVTAPEIRTSGMFNTDKLAVCGLLNPSTRMYGKKASFCELVWSFEYPLYIQTSPTGIGNNGNIKSVTDLAILVKTIGSDDPGESNSEGIKLVPPNVEVDNTNQRGFNNSFGRLISIDRERTSTFTSAVAPVVPETISNTMGGTVILPRKKRNDFEIGAFIPPQIVDPTGFSYTDTDLEAFTATTLWCALMGFRSTTGNKTNTDGTDTHEPGGKGQYITEIAQPINTFAYINSVKGELKGDDYILKIATPIYIDLMNTAKLGAGCKPTEEEIPSGKIGKEICIPVNKSNDDISITDNGKDLSGDGDTNEGEANAKMIKLARELSYKTTVEIAPLEEPNVNNDKVAHFFEIGTLMDSGILSTDFSKCVYVAPFVYKDWPDITGLTCGGQGNPHSVTITEMDEYPSDPDEYLVHMLHTYNQTDISCDLSVDYDWTIKDIAGYNQTGQTFSIHGVYFLTPENPDKYYITCPTCGDIIWYGNLELEGSGEDYPFNAKVVWFLSIMPLWREESTENDKVNYIHDLESEAGRYVELYNITRCDSKLMDLEVLTVRSAGLWDAFITKLKELLHIDIETQSYLFPVKATMQRIAAFCRGYAFRISLDRIVDQLLLCGFSENITSASGGIIKQPAGGWTLGSALDIAITDDKNKDKIGTIRKELHSMVNSVFKTAMQLSGIRITEEKKGGKYIRAEIDILSPSPSIVSWGLTEEGYEELKESSSESDEAGEPEGETQIILGGYE